MRYLKNIHIIIVFLTIITFFSRSGYSQDIHFSQFYAAPLYLSPSFTGSVSGSRFITNYRNQWPEIPKAFVTYALSYDQYFPELKSGIGILFTRDQKGGLSYHSSTIGLLYSYDIVIKNNIHLRPGIEFQYAYSGLDRNKMLTRDMIQRNTSAPIETIQRDNTKHFDASFSLLFYNKILWAGSTISHLMRPVTTFGTKEKLPLKLSVYSGIKLINKGRLLKPNGESLSIAYNYKQMSQFSQMEIGIMGSKKYINGGLWYRGIPVLKRNPGSDAFIISIGYDNSTFNVGISYDVTTSGLKKYSNGAIELSVTYIIPPQEPRKKKPAIIPCPVL